MIDNDNIYIFDYIFSINKYKEIGYNNAFDEQNKNVLIGMIEKKYNLTDFLNKNKEYFNKECLNGHKFIIENEYTYELESFPKLNLNAQKEYLKFKAQQIKEMITDQGIVDVKKINEILDNIDDIGRKSILDYCKSQEIIEYDDNKTFIKGGQTGIAMIIYKEIRPVLEKKQSPVESTINISINGNNNKFSNNDFSNNKKEKEKENIFVKLLKYIINIFKK